jgi:meso-butanediol dehydrogenase/(S,S)-butanediol dehydrogenase/diacetyl reductase
LDQCEQSARGLVDRRTRRFRVGTDMWVTIDERFAELTCAPKDQTYQQFVDGIALGRAQTPEDVAAFVSYLAGPDSDYMTGQAGLIDGGLVYR